MRRSLVLASAALAAVAAGTPGALHAQGSSVDQHSACMTGRVGTGVASPCADASGIYFQPAGIVTHGSVVSAGLMLIRSSNEFRYDNVNGLPREVVEREPEIIPVPQGFVSARLSPRLAAGIGVYAPYGLGLKWDVCPVSDPDCDGPNFEGRYTGYDNDLRAIYIQPTVAYQLVPDRVQVGAGVAVVRTSLDVFQRADAPQLGLRGVDIADAELQGSGWGVGGQVGAIVRLSESASLGLRYMTPVTVDLDGDASFTQISTGTVFDPQLAAQFAEGGALDDQGITSELELPYQWVLGVSWRPVQPLHLMADFQRTGWSSFDALVLDFANEGVPDRELALDYENTNTVRFGAEYDWSAAFTLRGGFRYNTAATPRATPFLPEGERNYYTVGFGIRPTSRLTADFAYQYIHQPDREGAVRPDEPEVGVYSAKGQVFAFTLAYRFGR